MEIIRLEGYTEDEKVEIAERHLIAKQIEAHGLRKGEFTLDHRRSARPDPLLHPRSRRAHAGARNRAAGAQGLAPDPRKEGHQRSRSRPKTLANMPGVRKYRHGVSDDEAQVGAVTGLAWTEVGGELLTIESVTTPGKGEVKTTGKLGDVMNESVAGRLQLREGARARPMASSLRSSSARTSTSTCPKARCPRTGPSPVSAWSPRSSRH